MDPVGDSEIVGVPREADAELGVVVGLDALHCYGEAVPELLNEVDRGLHRLATVELKNPNIFLMLFGIIAFSFCCSRRIWHGVL